jgi:hypothetical protein
MFLNYAATHQDAVLMYHASNMVLVVHSGGASYLNKPKACSQASGHFFMSSNTKDPANNGAVFNI